MRAAVSHPAKARSPRLDAFLPWMVSLTLHMALGLLALFAFFSATQGFSSSQERSIIVPNSFEDPSFSDHPGAPASGGGGDPLRQAAQDRLRELANSEGWGTAGTEGQSVASLLGGTGDATGIFRGNGATISPGQSSGGPAAYGTPGGGAGAGPRSSFYGMGGNGKSVVYLIDRTGSLDSFGQAGAIEPGTVKAKVQESVNVLSALQYFAVLTFTSDDDGGTQILGTQRLVQALPENKAAVLEELKKKVAQGGMNDEETIFLQAFRKAFTLSPQLIFFLTDGKISPAVLAEVKRLNTEHTVISTVMFTPYTVDNMVPEEKRRYELMTELARQNDGLVKVVSISVPQP
jgi:hypothetical protein